MDIKFSTKDTTQYYPPESVLLNGGINLVDKEWKVYNNQTSKVLNVWFYQGELGKRWGQDYFIANEVVESPCYAAYNYLWQDCIVKHCGTKLYKQDAFSGELTVIKTGLTANKGTFFKQNEFLYYLQKGNFLSIDSNFTVATVVAYIPTVIINRTPTGGGDTNENYNRYGKGFKNSFNGDNTATAYTLTDSGLDVTTVTVTVGGVAKIEGTDFTVNRTTGVITFTVAPATGTNNVIVTAYKTVQGDIDTIMNCTVSATFGGTNNFLTYLAGNGTGYYYRSGVSTAGAVDPTYWPYNNYNIVGINSDNITAMAEHHDVLTVHKTTGEVFGETYTWNGTKGIYNTFPINSIYGCDCPNTMQFVNNSLVYLNSKHGVCILVSTVVENQRNIYQISRNVNPRLLNEINLILATSVNINIGSVGQYWLCVNDKIYMWDCTETPYVEMPNADDAAKRLSWWYFTNINAGAWITDGINLFYLRRDNGKTVKFHTTYDGGQFFDFGGGYDSLWRYPYRELGNGIYEFSVLKGNVGIRGDLKTEFTIQYFTSDDPNGDPSTENIPVGSFSWSSFSWVIFTWVVMGPRYDAVLTPMLKNIRYFGAEFSNNTAGKDMNITSISWRYQITKLIK